MLQTSGNKIIDVNGEEIFLRGTCLGGWMNLENFIVGFPGSENCLRRCMADTIGIEKAEVFFDRLLDYICREEDIAFIKSCGATAIRISVNYRHFERDDCPFSYQEKGFERLKKVLDWCKKHNLYAIITLHAVQGCQNTDWHCDNSSRHSLFWNHPHFQDRFIALWEEFARRYKDNSIIAGYDLINEPNTNSPYGRFSHDYTPDWKSINEVYFRAVRAIRRIDPHHIIILEGDGFSKYFHGLEKPFSENLVYSMHSYNPAGFGKGKYPGVIRNQYWDKSKQLQFVQGSEGFRFSQRYNVPLLISEFGSVYNGCEGEIQDRFNAFKDYIDIFNDLGLHWTSWTYKDVGVMGITQLDPDSPYLKLISPIRARQSYNLHTTLL